MKQSELTAEIEAQAEQSYSQLAGKWRDWLEVARRFEHKARAQDRLDLRHTIILAFAEQQARNERLGKPDLSLYGMLRIASHCVADYWREVNKASVKVCVFDGIAKEPIYAKCSFNHKPSKCSKCPFLAVRPIGSLNTELEDTEGNTVELIDTLADDSVDIEAWAERSTWELGYPKRLVTIAYKLDNGKALSGYERLYLYRYKRKNQKRLL